MKFLVIVLLLILSNSFWACHDCDTWVGKFPEKPDCTIDFSPGDTTVMAGVPVVFRFLPACPEAASYAWSIDGVPQSSESTFTHTFPCDDTVTVTLIVNGDGVGAPKSHTIIVRPVTFPIRAYDLDQDPAQSDKIFGLDESAAGDFFLAANNDKQSFLAITDRHGMLPAFPAGNDLGPDYSQLQPNAFVKTPAGYLLLGRAIQGTDGNSDFYVLAANLSNFTVFKQAPLFAPLAGEDEEALGGSWMDNGNYVLCGQGGFGDSVGICLLTTDQSLSQQTHKRLFQADLDAYAQAIVRIGNNFWLAGKRIVAPDKYETFIVVLDQALNVVHTPISIGSGSFLIKKIIPLDDHTAIVLGRVNNSAELVKVDISGGSPGWDTIYGQNLFEDGIKSKDGRLIVVGEGQSTKGAGYFFEIDARDGAVRNVQGCPSGLIDTGRATCIVETADCGFAIAGYGRKINENADKSILFKTDRNGKIDP